MENAIIKVPRDELSATADWIATALNFTASSYPAAGGWLAIAALGVGVLVLLSDRRPGGSIVRAQAAPARTVSLVA
ncbi:MAG: hypothetical protein U0163_04060 [Gemmatimonadaceae bacterium]